MKIFWPNRSKANGFSIQNLARKYRLKLSSESSIKNSKQLLDKKSSISIINNNNKSTFNLSVKRTHWANRDFSEYKDAA